MDKLDKYAAIMAMTFAYEEATYAFYNKYAKQQGFSIRCCKVKHDVDKLGTPTNVRYRHFVCSRAGTREIKYLNMVDRIYRHRPESRCKCGARFTVSFNRKKGVWTVLQFDNVHNHGMATPDEVIFLRSHRKIKPHQKSQIMSLAAGGMRVFNIMRRFISESGKYSLVGFVRKDIYNLTCREKRKLMLSGDANTTIGIMEKRKRDDPDFYFDYKLDKEGKGKLKHLFWCDSQSRQDYADFGDVLVFDSTYKTNRYHMPFIPFVGLNHHRQTIVFACATVSNETEATYKWLLKTFLKAMYQKMPNGVITDGDAAMINAVAKVFVGVWHRVCSWHIEKNMKKHLPDECYNEFRTMLYYTTTEQIFEERWRAFIQKHQTKLTNDWVKRVYARKRLWAAAYLADGYFLGMLSN